MKMVKSLLLGSVAGLVAVSQCGAQSIGVCPREIDARKRATEGPILRSQFYGYERTAARRRCGLRPKPELGQRAADRTRSVFVAILHLADRQRLPVFDPVECGFEAPERGADARLPTAVATLRTNRRLAIWLRSRPDRTGRRRVGTAAQRACP